MPTKWLPPKGVGVACSGEKCDQRRNCAFGRACPAWDEVAPTLGGTLNPEWVAAQEQPTVATLPKVACRDCENFVELLESLEVTLREGKKSTPASNAAKLLRARTDVGNFLELVRKKQQHERTCRVYKAKAKARAARKRKK